MKPGSTATVACFAAAFAIAAYVAAPLCETGVLTSQRRSATAPSPSDALFDPSRVIQIEIRLDARDWHALRISHPIQGENFQVIARGYDYYRGDAVVDGRLVRSVGVRKKGTGSESTARPAFKIKFDEYAKGQEFDGLEMLTLNNLSVDPSKAQQSLIYSFMNRAGAISPRSNLARVVANGEDLGIYGHVESIDKKFITRYFGDARGDLYEGQYGADFAENDYKKVVHKWGDDDDLAKVRQLVDVLERPGPVSLWRIEELVDLDAFITFWASSVLTANADSYVSNRNNYYFYRDAKSGKFFLIPWGADAWTMAQGIPGTGLPRSVSADGYLCRRLWELPGIRERYRKEMRRLLAEVWNEKAMLAELDQVSRLSQDDAPNASRLGVTDQIGRFLESQRAVVQEELDRPAQDWAVPRRAWGPGTPKGPLMQVEGTFTAIVADSFPTNAAGYFGRGTASLQFTVDRETRNPFTQSGAVAVIAPQSGGDNRIEIVVSNATGDLRWGITLRMDPYRVSLAPQSIRLGYDDWAVWAPISQSQGGPASLRTQRRGGEQNRGTLELTQVSTTLGGTISGKFKINTTAFEEDRKP